MLAIEKIKELIGDPKISDEEAECVRDECQIFAEIIFDQWLAKCREKVNENQGRTVFNLVSDIGSGRKEESRPRPEPISATGRDNENDWRNSPLENSL
jgi:hypothetical protein